MRSTLIAASILLVLLTPIKEQQAASQQFDRFGAIEPHDAPAHADDLAVGWGRARFHWGMIQPEGPDQWIDAELSDEELATEEAANREVIGLLIGIPDWARDVDGLPKGLYQEIDDPGNFWATFVRTIVAKYKGRINHWIIWNEPDVWNADHPGFTWPGTEQDYVQLLKTAYLVAKSENPEAFIHLAAMSHWWDVLYERELYFERLLDALMADPNAAENEYYFDAVTLHLYFNPASIYDVVEQYRDIQIDYGLAKPLWLIETNAAPSTDPGWSVPEPTFKVSLLEQAAYQPQGLSLALAAGADRIGIYKLIDTSGDVAANPEPFGLIRADKSPRPAFTTAQVAIQQLGNAERVSWTDKHIVAQVVIEAESMVTRLLWSRIPEAQVVTLPALADSASLIDMWGNEQTISPESGTYTIILYAGECQQTVADYCMIGGPPVYLVEQVTGTIERDLLTITYEPFRGDLGESDRNSMRKSLILWIGGGAVGAGLLFIGLLAVRRKNH